MSDNDLTQTEQIEELRGRLEIADQREQLHKILINHLVSAAALFPDVLAEMVPSDEDIDVKKERCNTLLDNIKHRLEIASLISNALDIGPDAVVVALELYRGASKEAEVQGID